MAGKTSDQSQCCFCFPDYKAILVAKVLKILEVAIDQRRAQSEVSDMPSVAYLTTDGKRQMAYIYEHI